MNYFIVFALATATALAEDWPQFRGPGGEGHSTETHLPLEWSETKNIAWKTGIPGRGWSSPSVEKSKIWLTSEIDSGLHAISIDAKTGAVIKDVTVFPPTELGKQHAKNTHASPTPVIENGRVYVHFGSHGTAALTTDGEILWKAKMNYAPVHGTGGSPVLYKDLLIFSCDGSDVQFVVALDKNTGKVKWKTPRQTYMAFATPLIISVKGKDQLISPGAHRTVAYDPSNGKELWFVEYGDGFSNVPRPVYGHGLIFLSTGFNRADLLAVKPGGEVAWKYGRSVSLTPSFLIVGEELYMVSDNGIATCFEATTGKVHWQQRLSGTFSASPTFAEGRIYFQSEDGDTIVIAPGQVFKKLAENRIDGQTLASFAISDGQILLRTGTHLYAIRASTP